MFAFKLSISIVIQSCLAGRIVNLFTLIISVYDTFIQSISEHQRDEENEENRRSHPENKRLTDTSAINHRMNNFWHGWMLFWIYLYFFNTQNIATFIFSILFLMFVCINNRILRYTFLLNHRKPPKPLFCWKQINILM